MQKGLLAALLMTALALAGCSGGKGHTEVPGVTCPDGTIVAVEQVEADERHHEDGFNATVLCPTPPKVSLTGLPATVQAYTPAAFTWSIDPGSVKAGHSMVTEIRYAKASVPDAEASITTYANAVTKKEHQDLPKTFKGNMTFQQPGKVYVRAYAAVQGEGYSRRDVWSSESVIEVLPVTPTGVVQTVKHTAGLAAGNLDPTSLPLKLGDALLFQNDDLVEHKLTGTDGPPGSTACTLTAAAQGGKSAQCVFVIPGRYTFQSDDQPEAKTLAVEVTV